VKRWKLFPAFLLAFIAIATIPGPVSAHPPSTVDLIYDLDTGVLTVTITHNTPTPGIHYIENVEISRNGLVQISQDYTSQPSVSTFSYEYEITAVDGDVLTAVARCNIAGENEGSVTVIGPRLPMRIEINPRITTLDETDERSFTLNAYSGSDPVDEVEFTIGALIGIAGEVEPLGIGGYQFTYTAPDVEGDQEETLTISGSRNGYDDASTVLTFDVIDLDVPEDRISVGIAPQPDSVTEGEKVTFQVTLTAGGDPIEGADLTVTPSIGTTSDPTDEGGGIYEFEYVAPEVTADATESITLRATSPGLDEGAKTLEFMVLAEKVSMDGTIRPNEYDHKAVTAGGDLEIHWTLSGQDLTMALRGRTSGWIGIGFSPTALMKDADMVIGWVSAQGKATVTDCYSTGNYGPHPKDTSLGGTDDLISTGGSYSAGWTTIEFIRHLDSPDDRYDNDIDPLVRLKAIWALGESDDPEDQHGTAQVKRGTIELALITGDAKEVDRPVLWPLHAGLMVLGICLLGASLLFLRMKDRTYWFKAHRWCGTIGALSLLIGLAVAFYMVGDAGSGHLSTTHSVMGLIDAAMLLAAPALGFGHVRMVGKTRSLRKVHIFLSWGALVLSVPVVILGLVRAGIL